MKAEQYQPFGDEWRKEMKKIPIHILEHRFGVRKGSRSKKALIEAIRADLIVSQFNNRWPIGSKLKWLPWSPGDEKDIRIVTVKHEAFILHGLPVAFFDGYDNCCSIEPQFIPPQ